MQRKNKGPGQLDNMPNEDKQNNQHDQLVW